MAAPHASTRKPSTTRRKSASSRMSPAGTDNAIGLLKSDHREVEKLFGQFQKASGERQMQLCRKICMELRVHTQIEEEILYPASRDVLKDDEIVNEALVEHQAAKDLIAQIEGMDGSDEMFEAKMQVLQEQIEHHVKEEETEYFPQLQTSDMDLQAIGERLKMRKTELMAQMKGDGVGMH